MNTTLKYFLTTLLVVGIFGFSTLIISILLGTFDEAGPAGGFIIASFGIGLFGCFLAGAHFLPKSRQKSILLKIGLFQYLGVFIAPVVTVVVLSILESLQQGDFLPTVVTILILTLVGMLVFFQIKRRGVKEGSVHILMVVIAIIVLLGPLLALLRIFKDMVGM